MYTLNSNKEKKEKGHLIFRLMPGAQSEWVVNKILVPRVVGSVDVFVRAPKSVRRRRRAGVTVRTAP